MISLQEIIPDIPQRLPQLNLGEAHCFVLQSSLWANVLIEHFCLQKPTLVLTNASTSERMQQRTADLLSNENLRLAEWKHSRWLGKEGLLRSIAQAATNCDVVVFNVNYRTLHTIERTVCSREFLLRLKNWATANKKLLIFALQAEVDNAELTQFLNSAARAFTSLHMLYQGQPNWRWTNRYWFEGFAITRWNWELEEQLLPNGGVQFRLVSREPFNADAVRMGDKAARFIYKIAIDDGEFVPKEWRAIDLEVDLRDELQPGSDAVVVFGLSSRSKLLLLAERIFELRRFVGPHLRIIVRERDDSLRLQDQRLLIHCGANLVLPNELSTRSMIGIAETTVGFYFPHTLVDSFAEVKKHQMLDDVRGYLAPAEFLQKVLSLEHKAERQALDSVLIRATPGTGLTAQTLVRRFSSRRPGDIISVMHDELYLYLYGCRENDVSNVLYMNFGIPSDNLFKHELRVVQHGQILDMQAELVEVERMNPSPLLDVGSAGSAAAGSAVAGSAESERKLAARAERTVRKADFL